MQPNVLYGDLTRIYGIRQIATLYTLIHNYISCSNISNESTNIFNNIYNKILKIEI